MALQVGTPCPGFSLPDTEGGTWDPIGGVADVVVFTCNHCPYALAWHDRLLDVARDYADRGVRMLLICSNDSERYPHDSFEAMRDRVEREGPWAGAGGPVAGPLPARRAPGRRPRVRRADDARRLPARLLATGEPVRRSRA